MQAWIVRLILAVLAVEAGLCVMFLADEWGILRRKEEAVFESALALTRSRDTFVLDAAPSHPASGTDPRVRNVRPLKPGSLQPYFHVPVGETIHEEPVGPVNWSLLLKHIREVGCKVAAIEKPLTWGIDEYPYIELFTLDTALSRFDIAVLAVDVQRSKTPRPIPDYLRRSAIPLENARGEVGALVRVNRVIDPPSAAPRPNIRFSFRVQESVEEARPAFVRWDDYLIPSFPLAVAMAQNKVAPAEVTIELGRHIRLGDGPIVPINEIGELQWNLVNRPRRVGLPAGDLLLNMPEARRSAGPDPPRCAIFSNDAKENPAPWSNPDRLQLQLNTFDVLPRPGSVEPHRRLRALDEAALLGLVALAAALLIGLPALFRYLGFFFLIVLVLTLLASLFILAQRWTLVTPAIVTCLAAFLLSFRLARHLPARRSVVGSQ